MISFRFFGVISVVFAMGSACGVTPPPNDSGALRASLSSGSRVMWIGAHPDDESMVAGVLLAKACAADHATCTLVTLEAGMHGRCKPESIANGTCPCPRGHDECPDVLGQARSREMRECAAVFGAEAIVLGRDSMIDDAHATETSAQLAQLIARFKPDILVTHGTRGGYGHPAHVWTNRIVTRTWRELPAASRPALYFGLDLTDRTVDEDVVTDTLWGSERLPTEQGNRTLWDLVMTALDKHHTQTAVDHMRGLGPDCQRSSFHHADPLTGK